MKNISRRDFLKGLAGSAGIVAVSAFTGSSAFADSKALYTAGTYTSTQSTGFATIEVRCVFDENNLLDVSYNVVESSSNDYFQIYGEQAAQMCRDMLQAQSTEVDGISGATLCSKALRDGVEDCTNQAKGIAAPIVQEKVVYMDEETWLGEEPETPASFAEEITVDVAVVGSGYAGIAAVRSAVDEGASVALLEKGGSIGLTSSGVCIFGSKRWAELWPEDEKYYKLASFVVAETSRMCGNRNKMEILSRWAKENGDAIDWWLSAVPAEKVSWGTPENGNKYDKDAEYIVYNDSYGYSKTFDPLQEKAPCVPGSMQLRPKGAWSRANINKAKEQAGDRFKAYYYTPAYKLLREDGGRIVGVIGKNADGEFIKVNVNKGVVLATGDFMNNDLMLRRFLPNLYEARKSADFVQDFYGVVDSEGNKCNTGDGHRMAAWVGAKMQAYGAAMSHLVAVNGTIGTMPLLWLDAKGRRFINEDTMGQQFAESVRMLPGQFAYQIFDGTYDDHLSEMPLGHGKYPDRNLSVVDNAVDGENIFKADTLEELLDMIAIDKETAAASIARYNHLCAGGMDEDMGKVSKYMIPIEQGPFYAIKYGRGDDLVTMTGLESDGDCHVYDKNLDIIPGLYVAGNVQGNRLADSYPETAKGLSVAMAMTMGRVAGRNCANGI